MILEILDLSLFRHSWSFCFKLCIPFNYFCKSKVLTFFADFHRYYEGCWSVILPHEDNVTSHVYVHWGIQLACGLHILCLKNCGERLFGFWFQFGVWAERSRTASIRQLWRWLGLVTSEVVLSVIGFEVEKRNCFRYFGSGADRRGTSKSYQLSRWTTMRAHADVDSDAEADVEVEGWWRACHMVGSAGLACMGCACDVYKVALLSSCMMICARWFSEWVLRWTNLPRRDCMWNFNRIYLRMWVPVIENVNKKGRAKARFVHSWIQVCAVNCNKQYAVDADIMQLFIHVWSNFANDRQNLN